MVEAPQQEQVNRFTGLIPCVIVVMVVAPVRREQGILPGSLLAGVRRVAWGLVKPTLLHGTAIDPFKVASNGVAR